MATFSEAKSILALYLSEVKPKALYIINRWAELAIAKSELSALVTIGATDTELQEKQDTVLSISTDIVSKKAELKNIRSSKKSAEHVIKATLDLANSTPVLVSSIQGVQGVTGPTGPQGPPASAQQISAANIVDSVPVASSTNLVTSGSIYQALQTSVGQSSVLSDCGSSYVDNSVQFLFHCNGANNSTVLTDSGYAGRQTLQRRGSACISTTVSKFGGSSLACLGATDCFSINNISGCSVGTGDFSVDLWWYPVSITASTTATLFEIGNPGATTTKISFQVIGNSNIRLRICAITCDWNGTAGGIYTGTWHHLAASRVDNTVKIWYDGNLVYNTQNTEQNVSCDWIVIGGSVNTSGVYEKCALGYIDEVRFCAGKPGFNPYAFAVPTAPYNDALLQETFPSPATTGQLVYNNYYIYTCVEGGNPGSWGKIALESLPVQKAPGVPTNLVAIATTPTSVTVSLTNDAEALSNYFVATPSSGSTITANVNACSVYTLTGLQAGKAYTLTVSAWNTYGTSANASASFSTPSS